MAGTSGEIEFFLEAGKLKRTGRHIWTTKGIEIPETVAAHTFRTALMALYYGEKLGVDTGKLVALAILHDMNEAEAGEMDSYTLPKPNQKERTERGISALEKVVSSLPKEAREEYISLWLEENERKSPEGNIARDLNKLEMAFQALEYESEGRSGELFDGVWKYIGERIRTPALKKVFGDLQKMRPGGAGGKTKRR